MDVLGKTYENIEVLQRHDIAVSRNHGMEVSRLRESMVWKYFELPYDIEVSSY